MAVKESRVAAIVAALIAAGYVALAAAHGALGAARNDDWAYYNVAFNLARSGRLTLDGWVQALFAGQAVAAWPVTKVFGPEIAPLQVAVAALGAVGLWASYLLIRSYLPLRWSALCVGCLAAGPMFGTLSVSFMTDAPAFSVQMLALLAARRALAGPQLSWRWFSLSLVLSLMAFSVREYALAAGLSVCVVAAVAVWHRQRGIAVRLGAVIAVWLIVVMTLYWWRSGLTNSYETSLELSVQGALGAGRATAKGARTLALMVSPALLMITPRRIVGQVWQRSRIGSLSVLAVCAIVAVFGHGFLGNYFVNAASYSATLSGTGPLLMPAWVWLLVHAVSLFSLALMGALLVVRVHDVRSTGLRAHVVAALVLPGYALTIAFVIAATTLPAASALLTDAPLFDRYLVPLVPLVAAVVIRSAMSAAVLASGAARVAGTSFAVLAVLGVLAIDASATFDGAKWQLASTVEQQGVAAETIDGGYEWFGFHQDTLVQPTLAGTGGSAWVRMFSPRPVCVVNFQTTVAPDNAAPLDGEVARLRAHTATGVEFLLIAVVAQPACSETP